MGEVLFHVWSKLSLSIEPIGEGVCWFVCPYVSLHRLSSNGEQWLEAGRSLLGGLISSCGGIELCPEHLSSVIGVFGLCPSLRRPTQHRGPRAAGRQPQYSMFSPPDRQLYTLTHTEHRRQLPKVVGTASSAAPPFFSNSRTSSYMSLYDRLTTHLLSAL